MQDREAKSLRQNDGGSLRDWDGRAAVRTKPRRLLAKDDDMEHVYFAPHLVPVATHPMVLALGPGAVHQCLTEHLYRYLDFTERLEHECVNEVASRIARGRTPIEIPRGMRLDAYRLYCDEAYHALFSADMAQQVERVTGFTIPVTGDPPFLHRLGKIRESQNPEMREIVDLLFVVISETLISATLADPLRDGRVMPAVREMLRDHAEDEGRHHAYFSHFFELLWPRLTLRQRVELGPLLPSLIVGFLEPDLEQISQSLGRCGLRRREALRVVDESYPQNSMGDVRVASGATLRLFARNGVLDDPATADAFATAGLITG